MYAFAGATCVRYAEAKGVDRHQSAHGARHNLRAVRRGKAAILIAALACRIGTTCVRYAEAKSQFRTSFFSVLDTTCVRYAEAKSRHSYRYAMLWGHNLRAVRHES